MDTLKHFENECQNRQTHCMSKIKKARSRFRRVSCRHAVRGFLLPGIALGAEEYKPVAICQRRSQNPGPTPPCLRARPQCDNSYTPAVLAPCSRTPSAGRVRRCCSRDGWPGNRTNCHSTLCFIGGAARNGEKGIFNNNNGILVGGMPKHEDAPSLSGAAELALPATPRRREPRAAPQVGLTAPPGAGATSRHGCGAGLWGVLQTGAHGGPSDGGPTISRWFRSVMRTRSHWAKRHVVALL